jgi:PAS domain-containing protein
MDANRLQSRTRELGAPLTRCSRDLKYLWVSQEYADWLQKPVDKIVGRSILNLVGAEAFSSLRHRFDQALSGQDVTHEAEATYAKIGSRRIFAAYRPTLQSDGRPDGWLACVEDITKGELDESSGPLGDSPIPQVA